MKCRLLLLSSLLVIAQACSNNNVEPDNKPNLRALSSNEIQVSKSNETFAFKLFNEVSKSSEDNIFISPISVSTALGMTLNGAEGTTKDGILQTIDYGALQPADVNEGYKGLSSLLTSMDKKVEFDLANSIWYRNDLTINNDFANTVQTYYHGKAQGLNFSSPDSKNIINNWVENNTNHKIKNLIEEISSETVMLLINATYFKGNWASQFDKSKTKKDLFYKEDGTTAQVDMMTSGSESVLFSEDDSVSMIDLPYGNGQFSMTILLPKTRLTISEIRENLSSEYFDGLLDKTTKSIRELRMPKFTLNWKEELNEPLRNLGMSVAFSDSASFPYLFNNPMSLKISRVTHQSYIEVNEEGTEAAAATSVEIIMTSPAPSAPITINRPFIFVIREKHSKAILFIGQFLNP
ncbi:MAG TPA: serpin family protein [Cyclobacteriaceae bacterium]